MKRICICLDDESVRVLEVLRVKNINKFVNELVKGEAWVKWDLDVSGKRKIYRVEKWNII